jgi:hypothetical protein
MGRMTRTQITLEEDEYLFLKAQAAQKGESLSSVVRGLVRASMSKEPRPVLHIWELAGIFTEPGPDDGLTGKDHDQMLADAIAAHLGLDREDDR